MVALNDILTQLEMKKGENGFVLSEQIQEDSISLSEKLALQNAKVFNEPYAVYFRKYTNGKSIPQAYIYTQDFSQEELSNLHKKLSSANTISVYYLITPSKVKIFNARKPIKIADKKSSNPGAEILSALKELEIKSGIVEKVEESKLSAKYLESGLFLDYYKDEFAQEGTAYQMLLDYLIETRYLLLKNTFLVEYENIINKLLVTCILVKYLEEKQDNAGRKLFEIQRDFYQDFSSLSEVIRAGMMVELFDKLSAHFKGKVFNWTQEEKNILNQFSDKQKNELASYFDANIIPKTKQLFAWKQYSFNYLPVELISGIYEAFLPNETGVVYTPPYLVNLLIDDCMPLEKPELFESKGFKVLDPACGSGIFLVAAYKRLVDWEIMNIYKKEKKWKTPSTDRLKEILEENIFGVDKKGEATRIAIFSFCVALCERLSPMQILDELRFDKLNGQNIYEEDYFKVHSELGNKHFQLIIGNPPFSELPKSEYEYYIKALVEKKIKPTFAIPQYELSFLFLDICIRNLDAEGQLCLILPSKFLYNSTSQAYKKKFFSIYQVEKIYDFTHLSDVIFSKKKASSSQNTSIAICSLFVKNLQSLDLPENLQVIVPKRLYATEQKVAFELDDYDFHTVSYNIAMNDPHIWKSCLLGGTTLYKLIRRLRGMRTFGEFLQEKKEKEGWKYGQGYTPSSKEDKGKPIEYLAKKYKKATYITGHPYIETKDIKVDAITSIEPEELEMFFLRNREKNKEIFLAPHILIREIMSLPIHYLSDTDVGFKDSVTGIYAPPIWKKELENLANVLQLKRNLIQFWSIATSAYSGLTLSFNVLLQKDIFSFPFPANETDLSLSKAETIIQEEVLTHMIKLGTATSKSNLYNSISLNDSQLLVDFGEVYCDNLNIMYKKNGMTFYPKFADIENDFILYAFGYSAQEKPKFVIHDNSENVKTSVEAIKKMVQKDLGSIYMNRLVRYYHHENGEDLIYMIKPAKLYYWLRSIAIRDVEDTVGDLTNEGY